MVHLRIFSVPPPPRLILRTEKNAYNVLFMSTNRNYITSEQVQVQYMYMYMYKWCVLEFFCVPTPRLILRKRCLQCTIHVHQQELITNEQVQVQVNKYK